LPDTQKIWCWRRSGSLPFDGCCEVQNVSSCYFSSRCVCCMCDNVILTLLSHYLLFDFGWNFFFIFAISSSHHPLFDFGWNFLSIFSSVCMYIWNPRIAFLIPFVNE
jgi:hypothetical protein